MGQGQVQGRGYPLGRRASLPPPTLTHTHTGTLALTLHMWRIILRFYCCAQQQQQHSTIQQQQTVTKNNKQQHESTTTTTTKKIRTHNLNLNRFKDLVACGSVVAEPLLSTSRSPF